MENISPEMPDQKGNHIMFTNFVDVDHVHDLKTRWYITGVLIFLNKLPIQWHIRWQNTVEISTYGSYLVAMIITTYLTMKMRYTIKITGAPIGGTYQILGDNGRLVSS